MAVAQKIQVVVYIDPRGIGLGEQSLHVVSVAIGKIQPQFSLAVIQRLEAKVLAVGQPVHSQEPLIGLVADRESSGWKRCPPQ